MNLSIGPYSPDKILLCSTDAGPNSQGSTPTEAGYFFPKAVWVGAVRNVADSKGCRFVVLTTGHGMVNGHDVVHPYDVHISPNKGRVNQLWQQTVPPIAKGYEKGIMVFYSGGCPQDKYLELLAPIMRSCKVPLLAFGKPQVCDNGKTTRVVNMLIRGTTVSEIKTILRCQEYLHFFP